MVVVVGVEPFESFEVDCHTSNLGDLSIRGYRYWKMGHISFVVAQKIYQRRQHVRLILREV